MAKKALILYKNKDFLLNVLNYFLIVENNKYVIFYLYEKDILIFANL